MIIAIINNKGGTGKTTTCVNLAAFLASSGYRMLLVDLDSQASASLSLGIDRNRLSPSSAHVLFGTAKVAEAIRPGVVSGLDVLPGHMDLANTDLMLADVPGRERRLAESLNRVSGNYDVVLLDCPPSLSMLSINALAAADYYVVPVTAEYLALEGLVSLMNGINRLKRGMGVAPELLGILFTLVNPCLKMSGDIAGLIREHYGSRVFETEIKRDVKLGEAPAYGCSIFDHAPKSPGAGAYAKLVEEMIDRIKTNGREVTGDRVQKGIEETGQ